MRICSPLRRLALALLLLSTGAVAYPAYRITRGTIASLTHADLTTRWLGQPVAQTEKHEPINRAQILEALIARELQRETAVQSPAPLPPNPASKPVAKSTPATGPRFDEARLDEAILTK